MKQFVSKISFYHLVVYKVIEKLIFGESLNISFEKKKKNASWYQIKSNFEISEFSQGMEILSLLITVLHQKE